MQIRPGDGQRRYRLTLSLRWDAAGWPVVGAAVTASIRHDADDRQTLVIRLNDDRDGNYSAVLTDRFGPGPYRLSLRATGLPCLTACFSRLVLLLLPLGFFFYL